MFLCVRFLQSKNEIISQGAMRAQSYRKIQKLETMVAEKIMKLFELVKNLPAKERNIESRILNEILSIRPRRPVSNEVIEIPDDEDNPSLVKPTEVNVSQIIKVPYTTFIINLFLTADCKFQ